MFCSLNYMLKKTSLMIAGAMTVFLLCLGNASAQGLLPIGDTSHGLSPIEGMLPGSAEDDWGYSRRDGRDLVVFLSKTACDRWAKGSGNKRLTINGFKPGTSQKICNEGVNKAVLSAYFPPPLPKDCCAPNSNNSGLVPLN